ncbi:MAG: hemerythrin domain-containing protein [Brevundimonas sp.]
MSVIDRAIAAITPAPSAEKSAEATAAARDAAVPGDWLSTALDHHEAIRAAFRSGREAAPREERLMARDALTLVLNGHSLAEELVLCPAMARHGHKSQAGLAYGEQTAAKMQMAELEAIAPDSQAWLDKWEHVEGAVLTHMYGEEHGWFLHLKAHAKDQDQLKTRYLQEFDR